MWDGSTCCGRRGGFSLIELLIVVSIISILAAIAVPNFLEAQTRSKVSRVKADMRSLSVAVEAYATDNNRLPFRSKIPAGNFFGIGDVDRRIEDLSAFTTPVAYISTLPLDVFENRVAYPKNLIDYYDPLLVEHLRSTRIANYVVDYSARRASGEWESTPYGWLLVSVGPDRVWGFPVRAGNYPYPPTITSWFHDYDPTNGTVSPGNIYRFQRTGAMAHVAFTKP